MRSITDKKIELDNCNYIRAILMFFVILYHSMAIYMRGGGGWGPYSPAQDAPIIGYIASWLGNYHVMTYTFTFIAGYVFYFLKIEKKKYQEYWRYIWNKFKRLIVPYTFIALIWAAPVYSFFFGKETLISRFLLGTNPSQLWFLLMLFWVYAIFWFIAKFADSRPFLGMLIVLCFYILGRSLSSVPNIYAFRTAFQYMLFFYIGFLVRKYGTTFLMRIPSAIYLASYALLFVIFQVLNSYSGFIMHAICIPFYLVVCIVQTISVFIILQRIITYVVQKRRNLKALNFFSLHNMGIYLIHQQFIYFTIMFFNGFVPPLVLVCINFAACLGVSSLFAWLMSKTKVTRFLIGT